MTYADPDIIADKESASNYPVAFGITFTPQITGIVCAVIGLAGAGYLGFSLLMPALTELSGLKTSLADKETQLNQKKAGEVEAKLKKVQAEIERSKSARPKVLNLLGQKSSQNTLLLDLNRIIATKPVELISYTPGEETEGEDVTRQSFKLQVEGSFPQIQAILRDIERLQPLLVIKDFNSNVTENPTLFFDKGQFKVQGQTKLSANFTLDLVYPSEKKPEPPKPEGEAAPTK